MIKVDKLSLLYDGFLENDLLTQEQINSYDFNIREIQDLIDRKVIAKLDSGLYQVVFASGLFSHSLTLISMQEYKKVGKCLQKCLELDPTKITACFNLFLQSILNSKYELTYELIDVLIKKDDEKSDYNYYLYLLNRVTKIPEKYREYIKHLKFEDVKIEATNKKYGDIETRNKIRTLALQTKFIIAVEELNRMTDKNKRFTELEKLEKFLLQQAATTELSSKDYVVYLLKEKKYNEVINYLTGKRDRCNLNRIEDLTLYLSYKYLNMLESKTVPKVIDGNSISLYQAIENNDFSKALRLHTAYNEEKNFKSENSSIFILLSDICKLIDELSIKEEMSIKDEATTLVESIIVYLVNNDLGNAYKSISKYMRITGKSEYEFLIVDLIQLSILESDDTFIRPIAVLSLIDKGKYTFNISSYIKDFYLSLIEDNIEEAKLYLDIISKLSKIKGFAICIQKLYNELKKREQGQNTLDEINFEDDVRACGYNIYVKDRFFISKKYQELLSTKGILLLEPMDKERIDRIIELVKFYPNLSAFVIGKDNEKRIVFRYKDHTNERINAKQLIKDGDRAYSRGDYEECIKNYNTLLWYLSKPKAFIYARLGLAYMKEMRTELAIDYLTVATDLSQKEDNKYDFSDLIFKLSQTFHHDDDDEIKPNFNMREKDFDDNIFYGIDNFDEINSIVCELSFDVESVCLQFKMTREQINLVKLIYAREFYIQGFISQGDLFLKSVEADLDKSPVVIRALEKIKKSKRFYQFREYKIPRQLKLSIVPKKCK